jgi:hypothetical protein
MYYYSIHMTKELNFYFFLHVPFGYLYFRNFSFVTASIGYNHPVYGSRIWTHNHSILSPMPQPLVHGSLPKIYNISFWKLKFYFEGNFNF